ncbi:uncharacterized protein BJ171DRAFT_512569 [Polychytrium aggregatum]|uniref:uncharacterized protein n=1 Tax=Polychytrium aggregatum TaxID=110093 RepID=UPI0022FE1A72|nr:uncharacterized protein BJ171DRAFT_512569 [Polychytrium aggregatum]KAI9202906.1 hypothetical protein BJ171DRAFT_512569 [Polychytrium aggregatum]
MASATPLVNRSNSRRSHGGSVERRLASPRGSPRGSPARPRRLGLGTKRRTPKLDQVGCRRFSSPQLDSVKAKRTMAAGPSMLGRPRKLDTMGVRLRMKPANRQPRAHHRGSRTGGSILNELMACRSVVIKLESPKKHIKVEPTVDDIKVKEEPKFYGVKVKEEPMYITRVVKEEPMCITAMVKEEPVHTVAVAKEDQVSSVAIVKEEPKFSGYPEVKVEIRFRPDGKPKQEPALKKPMDNTKSLPALDVKAWPGQLRKSPTRAFRDRMNTGYQRGLRHFGVARPQLVHEGSRSVGRRLGGQRRRERRMAELRMMRWRVQLMSEIESPGWAGKAGCK